MKPLYTLPDDNAPIAEWARPLSATLNTRVTSYTPINGTGDVTGVGAMTQRMNRRKHPRNINATRAVEMRQKGWSITGIAAELKVSSRSVERALKKARDDG